MRKFTHKIHSALLRRLKAISDNASKPAVDHENGIDFLCNVCGKENRAIPLIHVQNREYQSCIHCRSSLRMRSVIYALSMELFGEARTLTHFPQNKNIRGLGMSDWEGYATRLSEKVAYTNTFYHTTPRLDITAVEERLVAQQKFLISSDVFEHIPVFALERAFHNSRRLLTDDGFLILTVPYTKDGMTQEHFPKLYDFKIIENNGQRRLLNRTVDGREEVFDNLIFHGGDGMTLEMRLFSEPDLRSHLISAGFSSIRIYTDQVPEFGILWPMDWAVPIVAHC